MIFICKADDTELEKDRNENIVLLTEEKNLTNCDIRPTGKSNRLTSCEKTGFDYTLLITDSPSLNGRPSFRAGKAYYFTSECY